MTRKEAIGRIQEHIHIHSKKEPFTPYLDEAFDMALEALEENESLAKSLNEACELLRKKRPHGEWEYTGCVNDELQSEFCCSICDFTTYYQYNFCPNCGARMEAGDSDA